MKRINNYVKCIMNKKWFKLDNSGCWTSCPWSHPLPLTTIPSNQWPLNHQTLPPSFTTASVMSVRLLDVTLQLTAYTSIFLWGCSVARCNPSAYSLHLFSCNKYSLLACPLPSKYSLPTSIIPIPLPCVNKPTPSHTFQSYSNQPLIRPTPRQVLAL